MSIKTTLQKSIYVLQLRYCGRDSIIQVKIDLIFIMVPLGEQKQMEEAQTYKTSCRYVTYSKIECQNKYFLAWTSSSVNKSILFVMC